MIEAHATSKYVRTSAQKAGLVLALIRGKDVNQALATLRFTRKAIAEDIAKVLRSAIANAQNKDGFSGDVDKLFVSACYANQGPSAKRVRPAPEKIVAIAANATGAPAEGASKRTRTAAPKKPAAARKQAPAKKPVRKK